MNRWVDPMKFDILTLFPGMFNGPFDESIIKRAKEKDIIRINIVNIRDYSTNKHRTVDDTPYGGGAGMVMSPEPVYEAVNHVCSQYDSARVILMCPTGTPFDQKIAKELAREKHLILICGHYEGFDERIREGLVTDEISIGDFVLTGGEIPAMVVVDAVSRLVPGVVGELASVEEDSFCDGMLEYPHYTRPRSFRGMDVPEILTSGHHGKIRQWRRKQSLLKTLIRRPDLLKPDALNMEDIILLRELRQELDKLLN